MKRTPANQTLWLWIACFAILLNALAPSVSHAIAFSRGVPATWEICRADGCAYCQTHAGSFGLPPATLASLPVTGMRLTPFLFYRAPLPLAVWATAQPRGPPAPI